jgi:glutamate-1-semialdehyde aminotransferase/non-ribosomal peptide synthetase component F/acyl carrier protein
MLLTRTDMPAPAAGQSDDVTALLTEHVAELLEMAPKEVAADVPLLELGADSIVLAELVRFIGQRLEVEIELRALFEGAQTIESLASLVRAQNGASRPSVEALSNGHEKEPPGDENVAVLLTDKVAELLEMAPREVPGDTPLLELGADSIVLAELVRFIGEYMGTEIELRALFEGAQSIDSLAALVRARGGSGETARSAAPSAAPPTGSPQLQDTIAQVLTAKVAELLEMAPAEVPGDLPLLELGADSIVLAELVRFIGERMDTQIELRALFEGAQTVDSLAALVRAQGGNTLREAPERPIPAPEPAPAPVVEARPEAAAPPPEALAPPPAAPAPAPASAGLEETARAIVDRFLRRTPASRNLARAGKRSVCNNRRSLSEHNPVLAPASYPIFGARSRGARLTDVDGNEYVDVAMGFGVHLFGHSPGFIVEALAEQMERGLQLGPEAPQLAELASNVTQLTGCERVLFCNTGTEAVMTAIRIARAAGTGNKIVLFRNSYHGHFDQALGVPAIGGGRDPRAVVGMAPGMPDSFYEDIILLPFNSDQSIQYIADHADEIAGVVVEPVQNRRPDLDAEVFLRKLRSKTREAGVLLVFDEVLIGFRLHVGGAQAYYGVEADIVTYGKILGGGMPLGIVAGRSDVMAVVDGGLSFFEPGDSAPVDRIYTAGTFCKNPLTVAAALAASRELLRRGNDLQSTLNSTTDRFLADVNRRLEDLGVPVRAYNTGSFFRFAQGANLSFVYTPFEMELFFLEMANNGVYMSEGGTSFLSTAHGEEDLRRIADAAVAAARTIRDGGGWDGPGGKRIDAPAREAPPAAAAVATAPPQASASVPLGATQRLIWQAHHLDSTLAAYHLRTSLELRGPLSRESIEACLFALASRHEALRARADGPDRLVIEDSAEVPLEWVELSHLAPALHEPAVAAWFEADIARAMDLNGDRLFRAGVLRRAADHHILAFTLHHLIGDGVSQALLAEEAVELLDSSAAGREPSLPPAASFRAAQEARAARPSTEPGEAQPQDEAGPTRHPATGRELRLRSYRGGRLQIPVDPSRKAAIVAAASRAGTTHYQLALACFFVAVSRFFGERRVTIGVSVTDRAGEENRGLVANCSRMLRLACDVGPRTAAAALVPSIRSQLLAAMDDGGAVAVRRGPLACCFNWDHYSKPAAGALEVNLLPDPPGVTRFPFSLNIVEVGDSLALEWDFSTDLFTEQEMKSLSAAYVSALESALARGQGEERPPAAAGESLMGAFEAAVRDRGGSPALADLAGTETYAGLARRADSVAAALLGRGVGRGDVVAIRVPPDRSSLVALLGVWRAGAAFVFLDPEAPASWADTLAARAGAALVLTAADLEEAQAAGPGDALLPEQVCGPDDLAYLVFTSGTTGSAKAVPIRHRQLSDYAAAVDSRLHWRRGAAFLQVSPFFVDLGYTMWTASLLAGGTLLLPGASAARDPQALSDFASAHRPDYAKITPSHLAAMIAMPGAGELLPSAALMFGGEALSAGLASQVRGLAPQLPIFNHYGPAEACIGICLHELGPEAEWGSAATIPIGGPLGRVDIILEPVAGDDSRFELIAAGARVSESYWGAAGEDSRFAGSTPGKGRFRTGDLVTIAEDGSLLFSGRRDDFGKWRGYRINPADIAAAAMLDPGVAYARAWIDDGAQALRLLATGRPGADPEQVKRDLAAHLEASLPAYMRPTEIEIGPEVTLAASGKAARPSVPADSALPAATTEERLLALFRGALGRDDITREDSLFEISSDSLQYIRLLADMKRDFGRAVSLELLFDHPTVASLAATLDEPAEAGAPTQQRSRS